ncbi:MAG: SHOCT domain-containing protein, partial [Acidobacteriota bacterium]|nr:SHOCT domain-containing protein [Acidobacteriota bacterium]
MAGAQQQMGQQAFPAGSAAVPAAPAKSLKDELTDLKELFDGQLITQAEYDSQRAAILKKHGMGA